MILYYSNFFWRNLLSLLTRCEMFYVITSECLIYCTKSTCNRGLMPLKLLNILLYAICSHCLQWNHCKTAADRQKSFCTKNVLKLRKQAKVILFELGLHTCTCTYNIPIHMAGILHAYLAYTLKSFAIHVYYVYTHKT